MEAGAQPWGAFVQCLMASSLHPRALPTFLCCIPCPGSLACTDCIQNLSRSGKTAECGASLSPSAPCYRLNPVPLQSTC